MKILLVPIMLWLMYVISMAALETVCNCTRELNNWWTVEFWENKNE